MENESLVSISDFSKQEMLDLLEDMKYFEANPNRNLRAKSWRLCF